jgi:hypothetical protein
LRFYPVANGLIAEVWVTAENLRVLDQIRSRGLTQRKARHRRESGRSSS